LDAKRNSIFVVRRCMECSICTESVMESTNFARTACGHTFHFQCLFQWGRKNNSCPLCRGKLADIEEEDYIIMPRAFNFMDRLRTRLTEIEQNVQQDYVQRPIEEFTGLIEERDIRLVMRQTNVDYDTAHAYLRHYSGDIVETILCLDNVILPMDMPIPQFRPRERPPLEQSYVSYNISQRVPSPPVDGYESC
jgi:NACalpha-BTF3-like transcription factor